MRVGLVDVDNFRRLGKCFPNLALMKISSFHKSRGDSVFWYDHMFSGRCDIVYLSKVFSFSPDYPYPVNSKKILKGGSGFCISVGLDGLEKFDASMDVHLPAEVEHSFPDYSLYKITDTAYGFMTRGCPRGCGFCIVKNKEGLVSRKVANVSEFWNGQKKIECLDPNILACHDYPDVLSQLASTGAVVNFNQGVDVRLLDDRRLSFLSSVKMREVHFAWDRFEDKKIIVPKLAAFSEACSFSRRNVAVYCLCNFGSTIDQDLERIMTIRSFGFSPYVMLYKKYSLPKGHELRRLQRWVNNRMIFWSTENFEDYKNFIQKKENKEILSFL